jgi:hypothetical protein
MCVCVCATPWQFEIICNLKTELGEEKKNKKEEKKQNIIKTTIPSLLLVSRNTRIHLSV